MQSSETHSPAPALRPATANAEAGLATRVSEVFLRPRKLFAGMDENAPWIGALVISVIVGILVVIAAPDHVLYEGMQGATTRRGVPVEITSPPEVVALFERARLSMGVAGSQPLLAAMAAGALLVVFGKVGRGTASFRQYLAVTTHGFLISAAGALVAVTIRLTTGNTGWEPALGSMTAGATAALPGWVGALNPFTVWMLAVIGVGVAAVNRRPRAAAPVAFLLATYFAGLILVDAILR